MRVVALVIVGAVAVTGAAHVASASEVSGAVVVRLSAQDPADVDPADVDRPDVDRPGVGFTSPRIIDGLSATAVLDLTVDGFEPHAAAVVEQCLGSSGEVCSNQLPVQFNDDGRARFQYLVRDDFRAGTDRCDAEAPRCTVVVRALESDHRTELVTLFHDRLPPPGELEVAPASGLADGQTVRVTVSGLRAGAAVAVTICIAPAVEDPARCGAPAATERVVVGPGGTATADLRVTSGPIGGDRLRCGGERTCAVVVTSDSPAVRAPAVPITFAAPPGADYDVARLAAGLTVAVALLALAAALLRRTDWSPVGEAAAPEIDDAEYADLDAIVAALPPEPADLGASPPR